jgi:hypothetical protein
MKPDRYKIALILIIGILVASSCNGRLATEVVQQVTDTHTPTTVIPSETPTIIPTTTPEITPLPVAVGDLESSSIRTLCLDIRESYPNLSSDYQQDIAGDLKNLFSLTGMRVVEPLESCDAVMRIDITAQAVAGKYGNDTCYTGSSAEGNVSLQSQDGRQVKFNFSEGVSTPFVITSCPTKPEEAPINTAIAKGLLDAFLQIWSYDFLTVIIRRSELMQFTPYPYLAVEFCLDKAVYDVPANIDKSVPTCLIASAVVKNNEQTLALSMLKNLGEKALPVVPELIDLLEATTLSTVTPIPFFSSGADAKAVADTLIGITGQDFGIDSSKWREWWNSNKIIPASGACTPGGTYLDEEGDVAEGYLDLLKVETRLENEQLTVVFFLKELPRRLQINQRGVGMDEGSIEYYWGVDINVDNDDATGVDGSWGIPAKGIDYSIELFHFISGDQEYGSIEEFLAIMDSKEGEGRSQHAEMSLNYEERTITLSSQIPGITSSSELHFLTFRYFPGFKRFDDFLCE